MKFFQKNTLAGMIIAVSISLCSFVFAQNIDIDEAVQRAKQVLSQVKVPDHPDIPDQPAENPVVRDNRVSGHKVPDVPDYGSANTSADPFAVAQRYQNQTHDGPGLKNETDLFVFISFSMPEASLMRIAAEAKKTGAVLVLRGFKNNSYRQTVNATRLINGLGAQAMVHPDLFTAFKIADVPIFVLADAGREVSDCDQADSCNAFYAIKGDVPLNMVLANFEKRTDNPKLTASATARLAALTGNDFYEKGQ